MADALLVLNAGSSSLKFSVFTADEEPALLLRGLIEGIPRHSHFIAWDTAGSVVAERRWDGGSSLDHAAAAEFLFSWGLEHTADHRLIGVGHRVVHGGNRFTGPVRVNSAVLNDLESLVPLAPLHQPVNLAVIRSVIKHDPNLPQMACFDTSFHRSQPAVARAFALPRRFAEEGVVRYGFHGLSYEWIASELPRIDARAATGRTIVAHLGNGASLCGLLGGRSVATTMGFSALDGVPMSTRCGSLDPGVVLYLMDRHGLDALGLERLLYRESGLLGVSGLSGDVRVLLASGDARALEALELFTYRIGREIGSLTTALGGLDALVFTAGIGENAVPIRERVCRLVEWLGLDLDEAANTAGGSRISRPDSRVAAWVIPTNEELMIARHCYRVLCRPGH